MLSIAHGLSQQGKDVKKARWYLRHCYEYHYLESMCFVKNMNKDFVCWGDGSCTSYTSSGLEGVGIETCSVDF